MQSLLLLLAVALFSEDEPLPPADVWSVVVGTRLTGTPHIDSFRSAQWDAAMLVPCASRAQVRAAHEAMIPPKVAQLNAMSTEVTRDLVVTVLDRRGRALCSYLVPATIDMAIEAPPTLDGTIGFSWSVVRRDPTSALVGIPRRCDAAALRISGWRGVVPVTFDIAELRRLYDPDGEPCR